MPKAKGAQRKGKEKEKNKDKTLLGARIAALKDSHFVPLKRC